MLYRPKIRKEGVKKLTLEDVKNKTRSQVRSQK